MIIYKVINLINNKIYIGKTTQKLNIRINQHKYDAFKNNKKSYFYKSIRKYGWDNFKWEIIDNALSERDLNDKEVHWISYYDSNNSDIGYNLTNGGDGSVGYKPSKETMRKKHENPTSAKLTIKQVAHIKKLLITGEYSQYKIAEMFNVTRETIKCIKTGNSWSYVKVDGFTPSVYSMRGEDSPVSKLTEENVRKIKIMIDNGMSNKEIGDIFNVSRTTILKIKKGERWSHIE